MLFCRMQLQLIFLYTIYYAKKTGAPWHVSGRYYKRVCYTCLTKGSPEIGKDHRVCVKLVLASWPEDFSRCVCTTVTPTPTAITTVRPTASISDFKTVEATLHSKWLLQELYPRAFQLPQANVYSLKFGFECWLLLSQIQSADGSRRSVMQSVCSQ